MTRRRPLDEEKTFRAKRFSLDVPVNEPHIDVVPFESATPLLTIAWPTTEPVERCEGAIVRVRVEGPDDGTRSAFLDRLTKVARKVTVLPYRALQAAPQAAAPYVAQSVREVTLAMVEEMLAHEATEDERASLRSVVESVLAENGL